MKKLISFFIGTLASLACTSNVFADTRITVIDDEDSSPIISATVFANSGAIIGLTDNHGVISIPDAGDFPVTVSCLGYDPLSVTADNDTVRMIHNLVNLQEVVVTPVDRPVLRVLCYIREYASYSTGSDTIITFYEHMGDMFLPLRKKVKGFKAKKTPRILCSRLHSRQINRTGLDTIYRPDKRKNVIAWDCIVPDPLETCSETDAIKTGAQTDTVAGKYSAKKLLRKTGSYYIVHNDYLSDSKNHRESPGILKLIGFTMDINELQGSWIYKANDSGEYTPADVVSTTFSLNVTGRGKWLKKAMHTDQPVQIYSLYEIYPMEIDYLTVEEANELINEPTHIEMEVSPNAAPLSPAMQFISDRLNNAD